MLETLQALALLNASIGAVFAGVAAIMKVRYDGKAHLLRTNALIANRNAGPHCYDCPFSRRERQ